MIKSQSLTDILNQLDFNLKCQSVLIECDQKATWLCRRDPDVGPPTEQFICDHHRKIHIDKWYKVNPIYDQLVKWIKL